MHRIIVCFDISDSKRRSRVVKTLETYGYRLQYSVFELRLSEKALVKVEAQLESEMDYTQDRLMMISVCNDCAEQIIQKGEPCSKFDEDLII